MNKTKEKTEKMFVTHPQKLLDGKMEGDPSHTRNHGYAKCDLHDPSFSFRCIAMAIPLKYGFLGPLKAPPHAVYFR